MSFCFIFKLKKHIVAKLYFSCLYVQLSLLQICFSVLCQCVPRPWQVKFLVIYIHVLKFYIIFLLTYFHIKIFLPVKQKIIYLHPSRMQTILAVKSIRWLCHWHNSKSFHSWKTEDPTGVLRAQSRALLVYR